MVVRTRVVAAGSALALIGALGIAAGTAAADESPGNGVTFSSQPAVVQLVTHYSHSPTGSHGEAGGAARDEAGASRLNPKQSEQDAARSQENAGGSDNTNSDEGESGGPSLAASFIGQQSSATTCSYFGPGCNPPDMAIAASPEFVFQGVNTQWEVLDTSGHVQAGWPVSAQNFFGAPFETNADGTPCDVAHKSQPFLSDPRALYDPIDKRFWAAMIQIAHVPQLGVAPDCPFKSVYWLAVSQTSDPRGRWNVYEFNTSLDGAFFNDFTQIGLNGQAVYVSLNMFNFDPTSLNGGFYAELFEANKAQIERGKAGFKADGFFNLQAHGPGAPASSPFIADTVHPAMNLDGSAGGREEFTSTLDGPDPVTGHLCTSFTDSCSGLGLWTMTNPVAHDSGGPAPTLTARYVPTKPFVFSPASTQPSCKKCVDASDLRTSGTPMVRNGVLYSAWETALNNGTNVVPAIEWAQVGIGEDRDSTTGYYNFAGDATASYGALMPESNGSVVMVFEHMSSTVFPEARVIVKSGDDNFHGAGTLLKAGEGSYRPQLCGTAALRVCRWGDYEAASWDGAGHIWFAGEYANTLQLGPPQNGRNWGTWIGAVSAS